MNSKRKAPSALTAGLVMILMLAALVGAGCNSVEPAETAALTAAEAKALRLTGPGTDPFSWRVTHGVDFEVYYGSFKGLSDAGVGLYIGTAPSFQSDTADQREGGQLGKHSVRWLLKNAPEESRYARECLVKPGSEEQYHIWVYARSPEDLAKVLSQLDRLAILQ